MSEATYNFSGKLYLDNFIGRYKIIFRVELPDSCVLWTYGNIPIIEKNPGTTQTFYWPIILPTIYPCYKVKKSIKRLSKNKVRDYIKRVKGDSEIYRSDENIEEYKLNNRLVFIQDLGEFDPEYLFHKLAEDYRGHDVKLGSLRRAIIEELKNRKT